MKEKIEMIEQKINDTLFCAKCEFDNYGATDYYYRELSKAHGMLTALTVLTGKNYIIRSSATFEAV